MEQVGPVSCPAPAGTGSHLPACHRRPAWVSLGLASFAGLEDPGLFCKLPSPSG